MRLLLLLLVPSVAAMPLIGGVAPDVPDGEAVGILAAGPTDLTGWSLSDGEDTWRFPDGTVVEGLHWFSGGPGWTERGGPGELVDWPLRLGNDGDDLRLLSPSGTVVDEVLWGDKTTAAWGALPASRFLVLQRDGDTDTAADWITPRPHRLGESEWPPMAATADAVTAFLAPDHIHDVVTDLLADAEERIVLHVYTFTSTELADALADAARRGVQVDVLITERAVGQGADDRHRVAEAAKRIQEAGGDVVVAGNERYRYHHLKALVVDDDVAIMSENWVPSGVPVDPSWGNRGWGVVLHGAAPSIEHVLAADRQAWDTEPFVLATFDPGFETPPTMGTPRGDHRPGGTPITVPGPIQIEWVISPDHTAEPSLDLVARRIEEAERRVWSQQLDLRIDNRNELGWHAPDVLHQVLGQAATRADVRVMVAAPFHHTDTGNAEALAALDAPGCTMTGPLVLHNKGTVVDDAVIVGSMNGNHHSRSMNRELSVIVEDAEVAGFFAESFLHDWSTCSSDHAVPAPFPTLLLLALVFLATRCSPRLPSSH